MNIKDYIHYYIGAPVFLCNNLDGNPVIEPLTLKMAHEDLEMFEDEDRPWRLMLRRLGDMTEDEMRAIWEIIFQRPFHSNGTIVWIDKETYYTSKRWVMSSGVERVGIELNGNVWADSDLHHYKFNPNLVTHYLLKQGFDLFGLIPAGLAIDAKAITKTDHQ